MASRQSALTPMASKYTSFARSNSSFMNMQFPLFTRARALYLSAFTAMSAYFSAFAWSASRKYKNDKLVAAQAINDGSFRSNFLSTVMAWSNSLCLKKYEAFAISSSDAIRGKPFTFNESMTQSKPAMGVFSIEGAIRFAALTMSRAASRCRRLMSSRRASSPSASLLPCSSGGASNSSSSSSKSSKPTCSMFRSFKKPLFILSLSPRA
mmetsp:Transcript_775/g.2204  ORF Transcript_775/g.2204 Transcript_775/m.2204 type:complete len:209 (-) Transcript_775:976-1602(-)